METSKCSVCPTYIYSYSLDFRCSSEQIIYHVLGRHSAKLRRARVLVVISSGFLYLLKYVFIIENEIQS